MSTNQATAEAALAVESQRRRFRRRRRWVIPVLLMAVLAVGGAAVALARPSTVGAAIALTHLVARGGQPGPGPKDPTSLASITQQSLASHTQVSATLAYAGSYTVVNQAQGTITALPNVGQVIKQGEVLYKVSGSPVVLLYGTTPAYRTLSEDASGADVQELNAALVALGYATSDQLDPNSDKFNWSTKAALKKLQKALGVDQSGSLTLGQAVFLPSAARITATSATLGGPAGPGSPVMQATSTTRVVTIDLKVAQQSQVKVGDKVTITLPNSKTTQGVISSIGTVATTPAQGSTDSPTIPVEVTLSDPAAAGSLDKAPVQVAITTASVDNALVVPVNALLSLANGSYVVEIVNSRGVHHLVPVTLGLFDDAGGFVQVTGPGLAAGQRVVVPAT